MSEIFSLAGKLSGTQITGYDGIIAVAIVALVEWIIKPLFKKSSEKTWAIITRISPIVLGLIAYVVIAIIEKGAVVTAIIHGVGIGLLTSGAYASIVKLIKKFFSGALNGLNDEAKEILEKEKK